mmetsp:Transcript_57314/g.147409  ORF Transcript_57314/g.147409 Transcript_57314/m.147409 type:complete len:273 (-) Transcript_57314:1094-1912(-)
MSSLERSVRSDSAQQGWQYKNHDGTTAHGLCGQMLLRFSTRSILRERLRQVAAAADAASRLRVLVAGPRRPPGPVVLPGCASLPVREKLEAPHVVCDLRDLLHERRGVEGLGGPVEPDAAAQELLGIHLARAVEVDHVEEPLRLRRVYVDAAEELLHLARVDLVEEGLQVHTALHVPEDLARVRHEERLLVLLGAQQDGVDEDACDHVHEREDREADVEHEEDGEHPADLPDHGQAELAPVLPATDGLEEGEHRRRQCAVVLLQAQPVGAQL